MNGDEWTYLILVVVLLVLIYRLWTDDSTFWEHMENSDEKEDLNLTKSEIRILKKLAKSYTNGYMTIPNLRITEDLVVDGATRCKRNLTAREINSIRVSGNVVDGAMVKGEIFKDNDNLLVKRGQRMKIVDGSGMYQVWTIEKED